MRPLPDGFDIPLPFLNTSFHIYFYGILIMLGVVAAAFLGQAEAKRRGINPDYIWDALFWIVLAGIVGARHLAYLHTAGGYARSGPEHRQAGQPTIWYGGRHPSWTCSTSATAGWVFRARSSAARWPCGSTAGTRRSLS